MPDFNTFEELLAYHKGPFELRPDQKADLEELVPFKRVGLFCEVGCGKTALGTYLAIAWDQDYNIVLMPPILQKQWERWLKSVKDAGDVMIYRGTPKVRAELRQEILKHKWIIMTLGIFKNDYAELGKLFMNRTLTGIVDEAHSIKNVTSENHKRVRDFFMAGHLQLLTGTPLSSPADTYAYTKLKTPSIYRSMKQFEDIHVEDRDFFGNITRWRNIDLLKQNLMLQSVRRLTANVLQHLHQPNYVPIVYELDKEHAELYRVLAEEQLLKLPDGGKIDATTAGRLYNALQQIVVNWSYFSGDEDCKSKAFDVIDMVCDEIDVGNSGVGEDGQPLASKLIIYTYYRMTSKAVWEYLPKAYNAVACYSDVTSSRQEANIQAFMHDPACRVLVAQPTSAGFGLNPQHVCWEVLFLEEPVIPKDFIQGVGRVYRDGQLHVPTVRLAIADGTIQQRLHHRLLDKDEIVNSVQGGYQDLRDAIHGR